MQIINIKRKEIKLKDSNIIVEDEVFPEIIQFIISDASSITDVDKNQLTWMLQYYRDEDDNGFDVLTPKYENGVLYLDWHPSAGFTLNKGKTSIQIVGCKVNTDTDTYSIRWSTIKSVITIPENIVVSQLSPVITPDWISELLSQLQAIKDEAAEINAESLEVKADIEALKEEIEDDVTGFEAQLNTHKLDHTNPHQVTKTQVGLGDVPNTDFTSRVEELEEDAHTHSNKSVLDGITAQDTSRWIDNTVNNLVNYYKKTETYTQTEVNSLISSARTGGFRVVSTLPTPSAECVGYIYLVPKSPSQTQNLKDEYICVVQGTSPETYAWEKIGDTEIDLSEYAKTADVNTALGGKVDKITGKGLSTNDYDDTEKGKVTSATTHVANTEIHVTAQNKSDWNAKYNKPSSGIPSTDLSNSVQTSLENADSAYQKPSTGIPASDIAEGVIPEVPVIDVEVDGVSVVEEGVASISLTPITNRISAIEEKESDWDAKYDLPSTGIPSTDLSEGVQDSLELADSSYQKPSTGIPSTDLDTETQGLIEGALQGTYSTEEEIDILLAEEVELELVEGVAEIDTTGLELGDYIEIVGVNE